MSELIDNATRRKALLKDALRDLSRGEGPEEVRARVTGLLGQVPHADVVAVEQELVNEGLPIAELTKACDLHAQALAGSVTIGRTGGAPAGHPVHTFRAENEALRGELVAIARLCLNAAALPGTERADALVHQLRGKFHALMDVDKHYLRKEFLLFPHLEKRGITGPPKVMWAKHDEARALLRAATAALASAAANGVTGDELRAVVRERLRPAADAVDGMIFKEENILLPMSYDAIPADEWADIARQESEYGWCLCAPEVSWRPAGEDASVAAEASADRIRLPSGSFTPEELLALLSTVPVDMTFVDADDRVRFFTQGKERVFARSRAILGRKVQFCHPPSSVHTVEEILASFRAGTQERAAFWIELRGRFVHIEYLALRGEAGKYLGCLEVSQDLTEKRALQGEQRLLSWRAPEAKA
ncbi:MAG: DUF438 domain-containing protein [Anaeromyxobacteraceae bacterium]